MATVTSPKSFTYPQLGAIHRSDGVLFRVWSPGAKRVEVLIEQSDQRVRLKEVDDEYFECFLPGVEAGATYWYLLGGDRRVSDPASRYQPSGVHGPSQVIAPNAYCWSDAHWRGVVKQDLVFYELHVGTFTREGTFRGVAKKLPYGTSASPRFN